ncbi:PD-(D/E)XK nuclease family protein, partial [Phytoactinopolyspora endophytica]|uniref:PD-(D/E)XK nuclease family protein n=1 Tax=Phytoactinopolyspora endophytica TaxID=1642495 RepID=UPI0013EB6370
HRGQRLQLPIYAVAARAAMGDPDTVVRSEYWFTSRRGGFDRIGYDVGDAVLEHANRALRIIADGISRGVFLARPNDPSNPMWDCPACNPDGLGEHGVEAAWAAKSEDPALVPLRSMLDGVDGEVPA